MTLRGCARDELDLLLGPEEGEGERDRGGGGREKQTDIHINKDSQTLTHVRRR